jgi:hypothetical protein
VPPSAGRDGKASPGRLTGQAVIGGA